MHCGILINMPYFSLLHPVKWGTPTNRSHSLYLMLTVITANQELDPDISEVSNPALFYGHYAKLKKKLVSGDKNQCIIISDW